MWGGEEGWAPSVWGGGDVERSKASESRTRVVILLIDSSGSITLV
jgi:hypothetical protein